jgi:hypothetical protein
LDNAVLRISAALLGATAQNLHVPVWQAFVLAAVGMCAHVNGFVLNEVIYWKLDLMKTAKRDKPAHIRMDNGPELISQRLDSWAKEKQIDLLHIQAGKPAQNAYIERFNHTYREDVLDAYLFDDLQEARNIT